MGKRILLAGVLGSIAMFLWSSLAHTVLPLGQVGVSEIPNESPVLSALQASLGQTTGLYFYPGFGVPVNAPREQRHAAMRDYGTKLASNPSGILIYHPPGAKALSPGQLGTEYLTELLECLLVAFLVACAGLASYGARLGFVTVAGIMAAITTNLPYWNWYGFPTNYTVAYAFTQIVGYIVAGLVIAAILKNVVAQSGKEAPRRMVNA
jgi:hypothetical protein